MNLIPMYGYPEIIKSDELKKVDEDFIKAVVESDGSREKGSKSFAGEGWKYFGNGDLENAMQRFNQSWLLNPNYYMPYWGFGVVKLQLSKASEATTYFEKALSLIDEESEKPRLLSDAARAYAMQGLQAARAAYSSKDGATITDIVKAREYFEKANSLFEKAIKLNPQYGNAYRAWAISSYREGNYGRAWDMVKKLRSLGGSDLPSSTFIDALSKKMPEPK